MAEITEVSLPGVGVRHEFAASSGQRIAVVSYRTGRRELAVYRRDDPDSSSTVLELDDDDSTTLSTLLGAPHLAASLSAMQQLEGLALDWLTVDEASPAAGSTIGDGQYRTRTGSSIVAIIRDRETIPAPGPDFQFATGDIAVAVGTADGLLTLRELLRA
jgi:TrkA domain protein